jgi:hypothetical protein
VFWRFFITAGDISFSFFNVWNISSIDSLQYLLDTQLNIHFLLATSFDLSNLQNSLWDTDLLHQKHYFIVFNLISHKHRFTKESYFKKRLKTYDDVILPVDKESVVSSNKKNSTLRNSFLKRYDGCDLSWRRYDKESVVSSNKKKQFFK